MNSKILNVLLLTVLYFSPTFANNLKVQGDSTNCLILFEINQNEEEQYVVSLISDTTWVFPRNIVSTAQITVRVPTGVFDVGEPISLIEGVSFFRSGRDNTPSENPQFDYISFSLGTQGTTRITFERGLKVALFAFENAGDCPDGVVSLMDNSNDPFYPPNSRQSNAGQQMTISGFGAPDLPIGIAGDGVSCNPEMPSPIDTTTTSPIDTTTTSPIDTTDSTPPFMESDLSVQIATQIVSCNGGNNGIIVLKVDNGQSPYTYSWSTGATTSSLENLSTGTYTVTIQDATGFTLEQTVTITEVAPLELEIVTTAGTATATVTGGTFPYTYLWSNGSTNSETTNLPAGDYTLTVTDAFGCITMGTTTVTGAADCPQINIDLDLIMPSCTGGDDGRITVTPLNGVAPFTYSWDTGAITDFINDIPAGMYMVTITDGIGCTMAASVFLPGPTPISVDLTIDTNRIDATVSGGATPYTYSWSNGATGVFIDNLPTGTYTLTITDNLGCTQSATATISNNNTGDTNGEMVCSNNILDDLEERIVLPSVACDAKGSFCIPQPHDTLDSYSIFLDGEPYTSDIEGCQFETFFAYSYALLQTGSSIGAFNLTEWAVNDTSYSGTFSTIEELVTTMNQWDTNGNWIDQSAISIIQGGNPNNTYGGMAIEMGAVSITLDANTNLTPRGTAITFKPGIHELIIIENATGCSETIILDLPCNDSIIRDTSIQITLLEGDQSTICLNDIFGSGITLSENTCPTSSATATSLLLDDNSNCLTITGLEVGVEEACYTITLADSSIIQATIITTVTPNEVRCLELPVDTLFAFAPNCMPIQSCIGIPFDILSTASITANGEPYTEEIVACNDGSSRMSFPSIGAYNLVITYDPSCVLEIVIMVACNSDPVIEQTIEIGTSDVVTILFDGITNVFTSIENICPEKSGTTVLFEPIDQSPIVLYTGIGIGSDTACIRACDIFGFCDTMTLIFHVEDMTATPPPINAEDDSTSIRLNGSVVLNVLGNDIFQSLDSLYILNEPSFGQTFVNPDATITYIAQTGYCDDDLPDTFDYVICDGELCDTATVFVTVGCFINRNLEIYKGLSPNGDGVNDSFLIEGIENYPNNSVKLFNRWGNMVFEQIGYKNEWKATWEDQTILPDGTYFYIVDLGDGSESLKGFLHVRR